MTEQQVAAPAQKTYTLEEVSKHKTEKDCWMVIHGKVLDIAEFLEMHPGGEDILLDAAGRDATDDFEDTGHSSDAQKQLAQYTIGVLEGYVPREKKSSASVLNSAPNVGPSTLALVAIAIAIAAALFVLLVQK